MKLTNKQILVLYYMQQHLTAEDRMPTRKEISAHFGWKSDNAAQTHIDALVKKNKIELRGVHYRFKRSE